MKIRTARSKVDALALLSVCLAGAASPSLGEMSVSALYDLRHSTDSRDNSDNFPVIEMKGFFPLSFGNFLFKEEIDLDGAKNNQSKVYSELDQSVRVGRTTLRGAPLYLHLGYSGGLGLIKDGVDGYYVQNAYNAGPEYTFGFAGAICDIYASIRYTDINKPRYDPQFALYIGRFFLGYKLLVANSLEAWTGPMAGSNSRTIASWELESEVWYKVAEHISLGTYVRTTRNVYESSNRWLVYPSFGVRYSF